MAYLLTTRILRPAIQTALAVLTLLMMTGCELRELCYDHSHSDEGNVMLVLDLQLDLDLDFPVSIEDHTAIIPPEYMEVCFYDPQDGHLVKTEYVGTYGGPISVTPGTYDLVVYAFGTEWTQVRGESNISTLEAFTSDITLQKQTLLAAITRADEAEAPTGAPIIYTPAHLLVAKERVVIPKASEETKVVTIKAARATIVETYSFSITHVQGLEYIQSVDAFVTNQARSNYFGRGEVNRQAATINFPVEVVTAEGVLHTTFNTFGKLPGESHSYLHVVLVNTGGEVVTVSVDITDQFEKTDHEIVIDVPVIIPTPESGAGIDPTVDPWNEENNDVNIG